MLSDLVLQFPRFPDSEPKADPIESEHKEDKHVDSKDEDNDANCISANFPLKLWVGKPAKRQEEDQHVLHNDQAKLVEVLKQVVYRLVVGHCVHKVPELETLECIKAHNKPYAFVLQQHKSQHKHHTPSAKEESVHQSLATLSPETSIH